APVEFADEVRRGACSAAGRRRGRVRGRTRGADGQRGAGGDGATVLSLPAGVGVYLANDATDMRKSFDGLSAIVRHGFHRDPFEGDVFAFFHPPPRLREDPVLEIATGSGSR